MEQKKRLKRKNKGLKTTQVKGLKFNRGMLNFISPEKIINRFTTMIRRRSYWRWMLILSSRKAKMSLMPADSLRDAKSHLKKMR